MDAYEKCETLGEGTFGVVFKAIHKETGQVVAIKKIRLGKAKEGVNMTALREIKLLKELHSPYIVRLLDVFPHKRNLSLVFEYMESDLEALIKDRALILSEADVKSYMQMLLRALEVCHGHWVLHRDVKPNNFLIAASGEMKLADFGLARVFGSPEAGRYTDQVFARWYRAPELLFGSTAYGPSVDMWAAGCVFAELLLRRPWLPGVSDLDQLGKVFQALGTPTPAAWPGAEGLPQFVAFQPTPAPPLRANFRQANEDALDLLARLVAFDPARRPSAIEALAHRFFRAAPAPTPPARLPRPPVRARNPLALPIQGGSALQAAPLQPQPSLDPEPTPTGAPALPPTGAAAGDGVRRTGMSADVKNLQLATGGGKRLRSAPGGSLLRNESGVSMESVAEEGVWFLGDPALLDLDVDRGPRPQQDREDLRYLRKRKLDMDDALAGLDPGSRQ
ncbi:hypothetical protein WJX81_005984 [Elliptochloris bilobata]|uniref:Protein kinase domain-containing protein n=1 Tax=Elliptochloris bilobata TaxID=381761 RepID=A0AAW1RWK9_9CHLO